MATFTTIAQLQNGTQLSLNSTDHIWSTGGTFNQNIVVGNYNDGTHVSDVNDVQRDITSAVNNAKFLTASTVSLNAGASQNVNTLTSGNAPFIFQFTNASSVSTSAATFYAYDGVSATNPMAGITFQAIEVGQSSSWTAANGSGSALSLQNQGASTTHNFFVGFSASPVSTGAKAGSVQLALTFA